MERTERVVIMGAGMAGLATALAFKGSGCELLIVERDPEPPAIAPKDAFELWERSGVPQFRHSHTLLARLYAILQQHHPEVLAELEQAGVGRCSLQDVVAAELIERFEPRPGDDQLLHFWTRRATFEYVLRQHVARLPQVRFMHDARVEGLVIEAAGGGLRVAGVTVARGDSRETVEADLVVDASGGRSKTAEWLRERGAVIEDEEQPSDFSYFCRHYRVRDSGTAPARKRAGATLDYLWYGTFFAEPGHFSIALACPTAEVELADTIRRPEGFDLIARSMPGVDGWIDGADAVTKVLGAGRLKNRWTRYAVTGPCVLGFFPVGDSHMQTNPMYGRGCSAAFVQAHTLAEVVAASRDPSERARRYNERVWALLRPQYELCVSLEPLFSSRGLRARGQPVPRSLRTLGYLYDRVWAPAALESPFIARESIRTMEMQPESGFWTRIAAIVCILFLWARRGFRSPTPTLESSAPSRGELLRRLAKADDAAAQ